MKFSLLSIVIIFITIWPIQRSIWSSYHEINQAILKARDIETLNALTGNITDLEEQAENDEEGAFWVSIRKGSLKKAMGEMASAAKRSTVGSTTTSKPMTTTPSTFSTSPTDAGEYFTEFTIESLDTPKIPTIEESAHQSAFPWHLVIAVTSALAIILIVVCVICSRSFRHYRPVNRDPPSYARQVRNRGQSAADWFDYSLE